jgi:TctA family transporter
LGLFAVPEIIDLAVRRTSIAEAELGKVGGVMQGVRDAFTHRWLVMRAAALSAFIGLIPGLGSAAAQWMSYAHAVQTSPRKEEFGSGRVEGVLAPGASANAKEGGALIPTIAFGVPGSLAMAILLAAFLIVGLVPGPRMLSVNLDVTFSMVWILVIANFISVGFLALMLGQLVRLTRVKGLILVPLILTLVWLGAFSNTSNFGDLVLLAVSGAIGYAMVVLDWPRPPLVLGLVLGTLADKNLGIAYKRYGYDFFADPTVVVILLLAVASSVYALVQNRRIARAKAELEPTQAGGGGGDA